MDRRNFLALAGAAAVAARFPRVPSKWHGLPDLEEATVADLLLGQERGTFTARDLVQGYLERIASMDRRGPSLHSILDINPDAADIAEALDRERKTKGLRGPLHGIPVLLKDNIDTADRMTTTAGSLALEGHVARSDAGVAARLRAAGAVLLAKTNMSEWANIRSTHSSSGWSARGGQCRNPYVLDRNPCGSSSGSAAAVCANLGAVAVGTETDGSIVCPASANGVVGLKPTVGLVSGTGIIPISHTQDTAGPLCRTVADAAALLSGMAGAKCRDPATAACVGYLQPDYRRFLDRAGLRGLRIGVVRAKVSGYSAATDRLAEEALVALKGEGAVLTDPADIPHLGEYDDAELEVLLFELKADLNDYLSRANAPVKTLADVIEFNERHRDREMPYFGQELFLQAQAKGPLTSPAYLKARKKCRDLSRTRGIDAVMTKHRLDLLVAPTGSPAWPTDLVNGDHFTGSSSTPAAVAGYPSISVPMGFAYGLPVNLSFIGRAWSEPTLIKAAYSYEQATKHRRPPRYLPSLTLPPA
ncbi:MAG: amidase [Gemmatimonadales bacterium]|nr:amidase [Gemmatimonadales bacterium]